MSNKIVILLLTFYQVLEAEACVLRSTAVATPLNNSNDTSDCLIKLACATTDDNNVISIATSLYDVQYENQWNNYSDTMLAKCAWSCRTVDQCVGFNFRNSRTASGDGIFCHLFLTRPILYLSNDDCVFYQEIKRNDTSANQFVVNSVSNSEEILTTVVMRHLKTVDSLTKFRKLDTCKDESDQTTRRVRCSDLKFFNRTKVEERCERYLENNFWTPIQRRMDGSINFYRNWTDYQLGFGNKGGEFWIGNNKLHELTSKNNYKLLVVMEDFEKIVRCALYSTFSVGPPESNYKLTVGGYSGDAGDSFSQHNNLQFSTYDADHDTYGQNCAVEFKGAWWYGACHHSNLNGVYLKGVHTTHADGVNWLAFKGHKYSLKFTEMKIAIV
ncbi:hypothetical protein HELRODRAFT_112374 [Helobdella robusta]|uniref:Fibrinogen C-terminal domain-containing protein n=1 Tax=Helobdella robusta TaxID=6412 RepID=T1EFJ2_HELRO|nr:hypothetical protein HELRODRAFT_112374 [Helobdella robusta]ESO03010.1 hypothetical protein HELRODRAFT_112374 [Helobdella robusta]